MTTNHRVLLTGGTGVLGRECVSLASELRQVTLRILSRRPRAAQTPPACEWVELDLLRDDLAPALLGVDSIVHLASSKTASDQDEVACRRLIEAAAHAGVAHFVLISIIGCDRIPLPFYATKVAVEGLVRAGVVPWSIVRVSQFHSFVERLVAAAANPPLPTPLVQDLRFQPVDEREVAARLLQVALGEALGDAPAMAGPELLTLGEFATTWLAVTGRTDTLVRVPVASLFAPGTVSSPWTRAVLEGYRAAWNTPHGAQTLGRVRFVEWLRRR